MATIMTGERLGIAARMLRAGGVRRIALDLGIAVGICSAVACAARLASPMQAFTLALGAFAVGGAALLVAGAAMTAVRHADDRAPEAFEASGDLLFYAVVAIVSVTSIVVA